MHSLRALPLFLLVAIWSFAGCTSPPPGSPSATSSHRTGHTKTWADNQDGLLRHCDALLAHANRMIAQNRRHRVIPTKYLTDIRTSIVILRRSLLTGPSPTNDRTNFRKMHEALDALSEQYDLLDDGLAKARTLHAASAPHPGKRHRATN